MRSKEEYLKPILEVMRRINGKPLKLCNGYNKFTLYAYGMEIIHCIKNKCYMNLNDEILSKIKLDSSDDIRGVFRDVLQPERFIIPMDICCQIPIMKKLILEMTKYAEKENYLRKEALTHSNLLEARHLVAKEMIPMLEKIRVTTFRELRFLGTHTVYSLMVAHNLKPTFAVLLQIESVRQQIPVFLLDETTIKELKQFWLKLEQIKLG